MSTDTSRGGHSAHLARPRCPASHWPATLGRVLVYAVLLLAALFFLTPLYVMLATSFKDARGNPAGQPAQPARQLELRCLASGLEYSLHRHRLPGPATLFLELGGHGGCQRC
jgi:hypothetical protein